MNGGPTLDIQGYRRPDGRIGARNHVLVFPVSYEMNQIAQSIVRQVPQAVTFRNQHGTDQSGNDLTQTLRVYRGFVTHPNVYGVVILSWGHEPYDLQVLADAGAAAGKAVKLITLRGSRGMRQAVQEGVKAATQFVRDSGSVLREAVPLADIILGTECGGSDGCSGISANPALGVVTDTLVSHGGISILSETTELIGAEHLLAKRAVSREVGDKLLYIVDRIEKTAMKMGVDIRGAQPAPGNITGGITTIEEKSLGCIHKAGSAPIQEVIEYAERPTKHGLVVMDTPGHDIEQLTGMIAGGAQVVIFTTGRGTPTGSSIVPVIKVASNTVTFDKMNDNIDINTGTIIDGKETVSEAGERLFRLMLDVLNGQQTKAEKLGHREFGIYRIGASF